MMPALSQTQNPEYAAMDAKVAELADAPDLGSGTRKGMGVRVPPFALLRSPALARALSAVAAGTRAAECKHTRRRELRSAISQAKECPR